MTTPVTVKIHQAYPVNVGSFTLNFICNFEIPNENSSFQWEVQSDLLNSSQTNFSKEGYNDISCNPLIINNVEIPKPEF